MNKDMKLVSADVLEYFTNLLFVIIHFLFILVFRRLSQPYLTKVQNQEALKRRQSIHGTIVHPKNDPKISKINASCLMSRRNGNQRKVSFKIKIVMINQNRGPNPQSKRTLILCRLLKTETENIHKFWQRKKSAKHHNFALLFNPFDRRGGGL